MSNTHIRQLTENDLPQLFAIRQVAYQDDADFQDPKVLERHTSRLGYSYGRFVDDTLACACIIFPFHMYMAGTQASMGGLAGVLTAPEQRRRGHVKALLRHVLEKLREDSVGWCTEYPFDPRFYGKYGWQSVIGAARFRLPSDYLFNPKARPEVQRIRASDQEALFKIKSIYRHWAEGFNFTLRRDDQVRRDWIRVLGPAEGKKGRFIYLLEDAYCVLELDYAPRHGEILNVHDYAFTSPRGRQGLLDFWGTFHGQTNVTELRLPQQDPLALQARKYVRGIDNPFQARVVNIKAALEPLASHHDTHFAMHIHDDFCPWNAGTFEVTFDAGRVQLTPSAQSPNLTLDVRALTLLISGSAPPSTCFQSGLAEGDSTPAHALASLAAGRSAYMSEADYF